MAGSRKYTALLDANVLFSSVLTDLFIRLHLQGIVRIRWSDSIIGELKKSIGEKKPEVNIENRVALMDRAVADACITGHEVLAPCLNLGKDLDDIHVLAAAIVGHCDTIVTFNLKDFPEEVLRNFDVTVVHPDQFLVDQLTLDPPKSLSVLKAMLNDWKGEKPFDRLTQGLIAIDLFGSYEWIKEYEGVLN